jgi:hypothetical protein
MAFLEELFATKNTDICAAIKMPSALQTGAQELARRKQALVDCFIKPIKSYNFAPSAEKGPGYHHEVKKRLKIIAELKT